MYRGLLKKYPIYNVSREQGRQIEEGEFQRNGIALSLGK